MSGPPLVCVDQPWLLYALVKTLGAGRGVQPPAQAR
jgi:hypothetical protein